MIGAQAGQSATTTDASTIIGWQAAGGAALTGDYNTAVGYQSGYALVGSVEGNVLLGHRAGFGATSGGYNTFIGYAAGQNITTGAGNVAIGKNAGPSSTNTDSNKLYINNAAGTPLIYGDFSAGKVGINIDSPAAALHVDGDIRIDNGHTLDFDARAYIDVNVDSGTGDDLFYIRRRGSSNEIVIDTSTASAPIIDSPNGTIDLQAGSQPIAQLKDDTGFIMGDFQGVKNSISQLANFPINIGTGIATVDIQGYSKIQNINLGAYAGGGLPNDIDVKLPVAVAGMEYIVVLGTTSLNLSALTLRLIVNGSDVIYNGATAVTNISYAKNVGESIHLICFEANNWSIVSHV